MSDKRLIAQSPACHIDQMAVVCKDHDLPMLGESCQRSKDVCRALVVGSDECVIKHERHPGMRGPPQFKRRKCLPPPQVAAHDLHERSQPPRKTR